MLVTLSAGECWMRPPTNPAAMHITACSKSAATLIVALAEFIGAARRPVLSIPGGPCHGAFPENQAVQGWSGFEDNVGPGGHPASSGG